MGDVIMEDRTKSYLERCKIALPECKNIQARNEYLPFMLSGMISELQRQLEDFAGDDFKPIRHRIYIEIGLLNKIYDELMGIQ